MSGSAPSGLWRLAWCRRAAGQLAAGLVGTACFLPEAGAVFIFTPLGSPRQIILQMGSANNTVNSVNFNVAGASLSPGLVPVTGVPGNGSPATTPANGTEIRVTTRIPNSNTQVTLTVDSPAGLSCVGGSGCGATVIPFSTVSWTSYNQDASYPGFDIQDGTFSGTAGQTLTNFLVNGVSVTMSNVLIFQYSNATLYPAGQYTGRVTYTATIP